MVILTKSPASMLSFILLTHIVSSICTPWRYPIISDNVCELKNPIQCKIVMFRNECIQYQLQQLTIETWFFSLYQRKYSEYMDFLLLSAKKEVELDSGRAVVAAINLVVPVFDVCSSGGMIIPPRAERAARRETLRNVTRTLCHFLTSHERGQCADGLTDQRQFTNSVNL